MAVYIKTKDGIKRVSNEDITKADIEKGLGYTPSDFSGKYGDIEGAPDIKEDNTGAYYIVDTKGNVILKVDSEGLHTTDISLDGIDSVKKKLENADSLTDDSNTLYVVDGNGNIIAKIDKDGIQTTSVTANEVYLNGEKLTDKLANILTSIKEDDTGALIICDENGNIIARIDGNGIDTVEYYKNGKKLTVEVDEDTIVMDENAKIALNTDYKDFLESQVQPEIITFELLGNGAKIASSYEIGTTASFDTIKHSEKFINRIEGDLTLYKESTEIESSITPSKDVAEVPAKHDHEFTQESSVNYVLKGKTNTGEEFSKKITLSSYAPSYIGENAKSTLTANDIISLDKKIAKSSLLGDYSVTLTGNNYIYFCSIKTVSAIKSAGFDIAYSNIGTVEVAINGVSLTYNVYRTDTAIEAGTYAIKIS